MRVLFTFLLCFISILGLSQNEIDTINTIGEEITNSADSTIGDFPQWYIVGGDTLGITFSLEQAQQIDNKTDLLILMDSVITKFQESDSVYIKIIDKLKEEVAVLKVEINELKGINGDKDSIISDLKSQVKKLKEKGESYEQEILNLNEIIKEKDKEIKKQKKQKVISFIVAGSSILVIILISG